MEGSIFPFINEPISVFGSSSECTLFFELISGPFTNWVISPHHFQGVTFRHVFILFSCKMQSLWTFPYLSMSSAVYLDNFKTYSDKPWHNIQSLVGRISEPSTATYPPFAAWFLAQKPRRFSSLLISVASLVTTSERRNHKRLQVVNEYSIQIISLYSNYDNQCVVMRGDAIANPHPHRCYTNTHFQIRAGICARMHYLFPSCVLYLYSVCVCHMSTQLQRISSVFQTSTN